MFFPQFRVVKFIPCILHSENKVLSIIELGNLTRDKFDFINLQYGDIEEDLNKLDKHNIKLNTLKIDLFNDFEKIAALLKNIDLFITVSNSTAHLAGALNVPTWLIKPRTFALFHYWNQPSSCCPWYPSIRLIEQDVNNRDLFEKLKEEVIKFLN